MKTKPLYDSLNANIQSAKGKDILQRINSARPKYYEEREKVIGFIKDNNKVEAVKQMFTEFRKAQTELFDGISELITYQTKLTIDDGVSAEESYQSLKSELYIISVIVILLVILLAFFITRRYY